MSDVRWVSHPVASIGGTLTVPGDKSISHRALLLGAVADDPVLVRGFLAGEDCLATRHALEQMGVRVEDREDGSLAVHGAGPESLRASTSPLDLGNSGTGIRLLTGLLAGLPIDSVLTGDPSLRRRPMERVAVPLRAMGADIVTSDGCPPITIRSSGRLRAIDYTMPVASAQVKSAILLAALNADGQTTIRQPAVSRDHTERMLQTLGAEVSGDDTEIRLTGPCRLGGGEIGVPGDFSSAAFFVVAGLLAADHGLAIEGVGINPTRIGLLKMLQAMGGEIEIAAPRMLGQEPVADIRVRRSRLVGIDVEQAWVPLAIDEFPVFFVAAAAASGTTRVSGAAELRVKESDRIEAMASALETVGIRVETASDGMTVHGGQMTGGTLDSHGDHRIAMAMAVAGLISRSPITIADTANAATSFPGFAAAAAGVGFNICEERGP
jgi:3-phosphoshikimate 1-carboxyvinyltransferase